MSVTIAKKIFCTQSLSDVKFFKFSCAVDIVYRDIMLGYFMNSDDYKIMPTEGYNKNYADWMSDMRENGNSYKIIPYNDFVPNKLQKQTILKQIEILNG